MKKRQAPLVLIVDDVEDNRVMYAEYMRLKGLRVDEAADGEAALAKARRLKPDVIVMDLSMPGLDGWDATRLLKADDALRETCIIAVTGHGEPHLVAKARDAGVDDVVVKPCTPAALYARVTEKCAAGARKR